VDSESIIKAREAMRQRMQEILSHSPPEQVSSATFTQPSIEPSRPSKPPEQLPPPRPAKSSSKLSESFPPLASPALPISADKDARLKELLSKYQADQITPEEYHAARAKILAEP
jgi:hypothetical protein